MLGAVLPEFLFMLVAGHAVIQSCMPSYVRALIVSIVPFVLCFQASAVPRLRARKWCRWWCRGWSRRRPFSQGNSSSDIMRGKREHYYGAYTYFNAWLWRSGKAHSFRCSFCSQSLNISFFFYGYVEGRCSGWRIILVTTVVSIL